MPEVTVEAFLSVPACSGGVAVRRLLRRAQDEYGDRIEIITHVGHSARWDELHINNAPGLVVDELVKFVGVAPDYACFVGALREAGLD